MGALRSRTIAFVLPALVGCALFLGFATSAPATTNIVPNPGFELLPSDPG